MKIIARLQVGGVDVPLVKRDVRLDLSSPGRMNLDVKHDESKGSLSGLVTLDLQRAGGKNFRYFTGFVDKYRQTHPQGGIVFARELAASLLLPLPLSLRRVSLRDVLAAIADTTGVEFAVPDKAYSYALTPFFYSHADGVHALDCIGDVFGIDDYFWQQQGDGRIFVGSYADSRWADKLVTLPWDMFKHYQGPNTAKTLINPALRPGARFINSELDAPRYVQSVQCLDDAMVITWSTRLSA